MPLIQTWTNRDMLLLNKPSLRPILYDNGSIGEMSCENTWCLLKWQCYFRNCFVPNVGQGNLASVILDLITLSSDPTIYSDPSGKSIVTDLIFLVVLAFKNKPFKLVFKLFFSKTNSDIFKKKLPIYTRYSLKVMKSQNEYMKLWHCPK